MLIDQKHIISKQVLEIRLDTKKDAYLVQDAFSKAYRNHIIPAIERVADRFSRNGEIIKIEKLEIDIGGLSIDKLDNDFPQKVERALEEILMAKLHERGMVYSENSIDIDVHDFSEEGRKTLQVKSDVENGLEILNHFLLTGSLPWWTSKDSELTIQRIAEDLLEKSPLAIKGLLLKLLVTQYARKRFIYQLSEKIIGKSINVLAPSSATSILEFVETLTDVQSINPFINISKDIFRLELWDSVLAYTLENCSKSVTYRFSDFEFADGVLVKLITRTRNERISHEDLFNSISKISDSTRISKRQVQGCVKLDPIIKKILNNYRASEVVEDSTTDSKIPASSDEKNQIEIFTHFLQTGKMPIDDGPFTDFSIHILAKNLLDKFPERVKALLLNQFRNAAIRKRFIFQFSDKFIAKSLAVIAPSMVEFIEARCKDQLFLSLYNLQHETVREGLWDLMILFAINYDRLKIENRQDEIESFSQVVFNYLSPMGKGNISLKEVQEKLGLQDDAEKFETPNYTADTPIQLSKRPSTIDTIEENSALNDTSEPIGEGVLKENPLLAERITKSSAATDKYFKESYYSQPELETEHINNAGLVLLWPFLVMFFERLNLVKDKQFIGEEASHRAIHLLQYLVSEQEETPEHELLFNKLLCGTDIFDPIPLGFNITENEKEECNALLQSVIDNWTVLKNSSIHALRSTFLQKEGILSRQANGWKLYIERTTVDVLLDRLPWSISMVVLPWSNEMIYVEW